MDERECSIASARGRLFGLLLTAAVLFPATAGVTPVLMIGRDGRVSVRNDPFLGGTMVTPAPMREPAVARARAARMPGRNETRQQRTPVSELIRLHRTGQIDQSDYVTYRASWAAALRLARHLHGVRAAELWSVIANLRAIATAGRLTAGRLPALFLTLERNRQWWARGPLLST